MTEITQGNKYTINLIEPYSEFGNIFAQITAICKLATVEMFGDNDIRDRFFKNVGILSYLTMVTESTDIYVAIPITNVEPFETDASKPIFIPRTIIDFNNSYEWKEKSKYIFKIEGITRYFETSVEAKEFGQKIENSIISALNDTDELCTDLLSISMDSSSYIASMPAIKDELITKENNLRSRKELMQAKDRALFKEQERIKTMLENIRRREEEADRIFNGNFNAKSDELSNLISANEIYKSNARACVDYINALMVHLIYIATDNDRISLKKLKNELECIEHLYKAAYGDNSVNSLAYIKTPENIPEYYLSSELNTPGSEAITWSSGTRATTSINRLTKRVICFDNGSFYLSTSLKGWVELSTIKDKIVRKERNTESNEES